MVKQILALVGLTLSLSANAAVIEVGDLNIINDPGNASDGLRFLDMSYTDGLTLAAALTNSQGTYANARLATPAEWDDLFAAAGIAYDGALSASDAFEVGDGAQISTGLNYDSAALRNQLGLTRSLLTLIFSDPDGDSSLSSTRDYINLSDTSAIFYNNSLVAPNSSIGWLVVSEVPLPAAAWLFISALGGLVVAKRKQLKA